MSTKRRKPANPRYLDKGSRKSVDASKPNWDSSQRGQGLVFKGGTCLSKVHAVFFRLSEDLNFGMSVKPNAGRGDRRRVAQPVEVHLAGVTVRLFQTRAKVIPRIIRIC
jgi:hypothetical protein